MLNILTVAVSEGFSGKKFLSTLHKILKFHLISWCGNFVESTVSAECRVNRELPETLRKLRVSTKFSQQKIR